MKFHKILTLFVLLLTLPALAVPPQAEFIPMFNQTHGASTQTDFLYSYDDVLDLLDELEDGDLEERCTPEELDRIYHFIVHLARNGILPDEVHGEQALEADIQELFQYEEPGHGFMFSAGGEFLLVPDIAYGNSDMPQCKSWIKKKVHQAKKFV
ncbi:MAG: hypothetical protein V4492_05385, partial [Chlamydiota bacterium]